MVPVVLPPSSAASPEAPARAYSYFVLAALVVAYALNVLDRVLISILNEPIREAFRLTDLQMGLLGGPAFAILYTIVGLPIARLADDFDRRLIIASCLVIWSAMTVLCGMAGVLSPYWHAALFAVLLAPLLAIFLLRRMWVGFAFVGAATVLSILSLPVLASASMLAFALLLISRVGVGIGEAGLIPPANSLIADFFPRKQRGTALSIFSLGAPLGAMAAALLGAWLGESYGWRVAFLALGAPGIAIGLLILLTVKEPTREKAEAPPDLLTVLRILLRSGVFRHVVIGASISSFVSYGTGQFTFAFFYRTHGLSPMEASLYFVAVAGLASAMGTFLGGFLSDRLAPWLPRAPALIPGFSLLLSAPCYVIAFLAPSPPILLAALTLGALLHYTYVGPTFLLTQNIVGPRMRATAIAILAFVIALIGYGLGPPLVGLLSDVLTARSLAQATGANYAALCLSTADAPGCAPARAQGLRLALIFSVLGYAWAGVHFLLGARHLHTENQQTKTS